MKNSNHSDSKSVTTTVELQGTYEQIASILGQKQEDTLELDSMTQDLAAVVDIIRRTDGTTKSKIVAELPASTTADLDADAVIHILRVLELYDIVTLDGNTWMLGPSARGT